MTDRSGLSHEIEPAIESFDRAFIEGRLEDFLAHFADDAQLLLHNQEAVVGKEAIAGAFRPVFDGFDASAYDPHYEFVDVHDGHGYVLASFTEVLRPKDGGPGIRIRGRVVQFWQHDQEGSWTLRVLLTGRSAPEESE